MADYRALAEDNPAFHRAELFRGIIVQKMSKSPLRDFLVSGIVARLQTAARPGMLVRQEASLLLSDSVPELDVAVVLGAREDYRDRHPTTAELVVEIAVTSLATDREKAALYAEASVGEYWIVLAEAERVEVYRRPEGGAYLERRLYRRGEQIEAVGVTGAPVTVDSLFT